MELREIDGRIGAIRQKLDQVFREAGEEMDLMKVSVLDGADSAARAKEVCALNDELEALYREREQRMKLGEIRDGVRQILPYRMPGDDQAADLVSGRSGGWGMVRLGKLFVESQAYKGYRGGGAGPSAELDVDLKALFQTSAGWPPDVIRTGRVVEFATRPIQVLDLIPVATTTQNAVAYLEETTFTNAAAETAEGGAYPEAALALTERTSPVRKVAVFLPVTDEQLEDVQGVQDYVEQRLTFMLRQRLDGQVLVGSGTAPNLTGILNTAGIQTQAKGTDPAPDAIYKAIVKVRVTGRAQPNAVVIHPNDWQEIRLLRTADGVYIWGNPSESGVERIWGLPVVQSDALTEGTALVGDFANFCRLYNRRGIEVQVSNSHADYFAAGKQAIRADVRVAFVVERPAAFCSVTGI